MTESRYVFFAKNGTSLPANGREDEPSCLPQDVRPTPVMKLMLPPYSGAERVAPSRTMAAMAPME